MASNLNKFRKPLESAIKIPQLFFLKKDKPQLFFSPKLQSHLEPRLQNKPYMHGCKCANQAKET